MEFKHLEPKTEKGYISLGMSKRMSKRISFFELTNERWVREKFSTNEELHNSMKMTDISRDVSKDISKDNL